MTITDFPALRWHDDRRALIEPPGLSPIVADPTFLFPEETPDGTWRLFAHTAFGVRAWTSSDGMAWRSLALVVVNAMRPFVRRFSDGYRLYYEAYRPLAIPLQLLPRRPRWSSRIEVRFSRDLRSWGPPRTLVEPILPWQRDERLGDAVGNPCLVPDGGWRRAHVYACDARLRESDARWHLYYNARDGWRAARGRERIGRLSAAA